MLLNQLIPQRWRFYLTDSFILCFLTGMRFLNILINLAILYFFFSVISKVKKNKKDKPKTDKPFRFFMPSQQFPESLVPSKIQSEKLPSIMSGEASKESFRLSNAVVVGKSFTHAWTIINDGTVPWGHVSFHPINLLP